MTPPKPKARPPATKRRPRSAAATPRPTHDHLGYRLVKAATAVRAATAAALAPLRLSPQEFGLLNQVRVQPGLTQAQLGALLGIDRTTVVAMLDRLAAPGWIERTPDADDRRVYRIAPTPAGLALHTQAEAAVLAVERQCLGGTGAADAATLMRLLALLGRNAEGG